MSQSNLKLNNSYRKNPMEYLLPVSFFKLRNFLLKYLNRKIAFVIFNVVVIYISILGFVKERKKEEGQIFQGEVTSIFLAFNFILSTKNSILSTLFDLKYEEQLYYHKFFTLYTLLMGSLHGGRIFYHTSMKIKTTKMFTGVCISSSIFLIAAVGFLYRYAQKQKVNFMTFLWLHRASFVMAYVSCFFHGAYKTIYLGVALSWTDLAIRITSSIINKRRLELIDHQIINDQYIHLKFQNKNFQYTAGQHCYFYNFPNFMVNHPFSMISIPSDNKVEFLIKLAKNWTQDLKKQLQNQKYVNLYLDGPYGSVTFDNQQDNWIYLSTGAGFTPFLSQCKQQIEIIVQHKIKKTVTFVWTTRYLTIQSFVQNLQDLVNKHNIQEYVKFEFYVTKQKLETKQENYHEGRPDFKDIFNRLIKQNIDNKICICGPKPFEEDIKKKLKNYDNYKLIVETFNPLKI